MSTSKEARGSDRRGTIGHSIVPAPASRVAFIEAMARVPKLAPLELTRIALRAFRDQDMVPWMDPIDRLAREMGVDLAGLVNAPPEMRNVHIAMAIAVDLLQGTIAQGNDADECRLAIELLAPRDMMDAFGDSLPLAMPRFPGWFADVARRRTDRSGVTRLAVSRK